MPTWADVWAECSDRLGSSDDARHIVEQACGHAGVAWLLTTDTSAPQHGIEAVEKMVQRRIDGEPLQYVLGSWAFRALNLHVDSRVLIPRPETEQVAEVALDAITGVDDPDVVDLGTGSGAIALAIASERRDARVVATDDSIDALDVARDNALRLGIGIEFVQGEWFDALAGHGPFDLVVSNPPYVADHERGLLDSTVVDWEPKSALFAGPDGLDDIRTIVTRASGWLGPRGVLVVELAPSQADVVEQLALDSGFARAEVGTDLAGRKRWIVARR